MRITNQSQLFIGLFIAQHIITTVCLRWID